MHKPLMNGSTGRSSSQQPATACGTTMHGVKVCELVSMPCVSDVRFMSGVFLDDLTLGVLLTGL
jgi:hypothetical protein